MEIFNEIIDIVNEDDGVSKSKKIAYGLLHL